MSHVVANIIADIILKILLPTIYICVSSFIVYILLKITNNSPNYATLLYLIILLSLTIILITIYDLCVNIVIILIVIYSPIIIVIPALYF